METPSIVAGLRSLEISGTPYQTYCDYINRIVKRTAVTKGFRRGDNCIYQDDRVRFTYVDNDYGNNKFRVEINRSSWNNLPEDINPFMVNEGGKWNYVYEYLESRDVLLFHIPGDWFHILVHYLSSSRT